MTLAATLLLTACSTFPLAPPTPPPPPSATTIAPDLPPAWTAPGAADLAGLADLTARAATAAPAAPWWSAFGDPTLTALVEEALAASHDLDAAAARVAQAEARARIAGAALYPQMDGAFSAGRARRNFIGFPIPGPPGGDPPVLSSTNTTYGVSLNLSWEADLWGRIRAGRSAAVESIAAAEADLGAAALSFAAQTAKAYFALAEAREQAALARATLASRGSTTGSIRRRYEAGLVGPLELRLARTEEATARATLEARDVAEDAAARQLQILLGRYPDRIWAEGPAPPDLLPPPPPPIPPGLPSELVARRPDLGAAERRLAAAGFRVAEARAALYPQVRLTGSAGRSSEELGDLLDQDFSVWSLAGNLLQPILQGGRLKAGVDLATATFDEATAIYAAAVLRAFGEVETALAADYLLARQVETLAAVAEEARAAEKLATQRYRSGLQDFLTVLDTQRSSAAAESRWLEARRRRLEARVDLILALGGGYEAAEAQEAHGEASPRAGSAGAEPGRFNRSRSLKRPGSAPAEPAPTSSQRVPASRERAHATATHPPRTP